MGRHARVPTLNRPAGAVRLPADELIARVAKAAHPDLSPTNVVIRRDPTAPASLAVGAGRQVFVNPYSGAILGERERAGGSRLLSRHGRVASIRGHGRRQPSDGKSHHGRSESDVPVHRDERPVPLVAAYMDLGGGSERRVVQAAGCRARRVISTGTTRSDSGRRFRSRSSSRAGSSSRIPGRRRWFTARMAKSRRRPQEQLPVKGLARQGRERCERVRKRRVPNLAAVVGKAEAHMPDWKTITVALPVWKCSPRCSDA